MAQPSSYKLQENEIEVTLDFEQEAEAAAGGCSFGEGSRNGSDKLKHQSIPDDNDDVIFVGVVKQRGTNMKAECSGSHGGSGDPQQEEQKLATARDPPARRTRPRIQLGLTPRQLRELEAAFEKTKYPDVITRRSLAKQLYLAESKVKTWFKKRRCKYRKEQQSQALESASADSQSAAQ